MNRKILNGWLAGILGLVTAFAAAAASADDQHFSLSSGFDNNSEKYETGPWMFKLTAPIGLFGMRKADSKMLPTGINGITGYMRPGLNDTEAAASYNLYTGSATSPEINLTGTVSVNVADTLNTLSLNQNDYAAQMDVYQNLDKFTAKGTLGSKMMGSPTGVTLNPMLYGSFGGIYQLSEKTSTGIDMSLSQASPATGIKQQAFSAFVNYKLDNNFKARGYLFRENTSGTPNNTVGGEVYYGF